MKPSTKDKVEGAIHEIQGSVKETVGNITDNPKLETKGAIEKIAGKVQQKIGQIKDVLGR